MIGTKYLSEAVDINNLEKEKLNIIKAPTGSGKTYFALHEISSLCQNALHQAVYLIDTINGKEPMLRNAINIGFETLKGTICGFKRTAASLL